MSLNVPVLSKVEVIAWATPKAGDSLEKLFNTMIEFGNTVLEVDPDNNRLKILHSIDERGTP